MPITSYTRVGQFVISWTPLVPEQGFKPSEVGEAVTERYYLSKPDPIKRPRPDDLFANATPWVVHSARTVYHQSTYSQVVPGYNQLFSGPSSYWGQFQAPPYPMLADLTDFALVDLKLRLRIKDQKVDLLAAAAEAGKVADMLFGAAKDLLEAFSKLKRGYPKVAVRRLLSDPKTRADRAVAKRWLEWQWGFLPVLADIYGAAEALATRMNEGMYIYTTARDTVAKGWSPSGPVTGSGVWTRKYKARARFKVSSAQLMQLSSLGVTNPLASLYQIIPWSFALDWISNTGDIIEGLDALVGIPEVLVQRGCGTDASIGYVLVPMGGGASSYEKVRQRFGASTGLSFGAPQLKSFFDTNDQGTRLANVLALIRQIVR